MEVVLEHVTKKFKNRDKKKDDIIAVNDFTFTIPDGKLIGLLGPSGCGKSTTLNLICGLLTVDSGKIYFGDNDVTYLAPEHRGVGLVFQNYALYPHMTVRENIVFPLGNLKGKDKLTKEEMNSKALEVAKLVQIEELMDRKPNELSGGQQQRVAIARALVKMPSVLLLDEPLSNLDARLRLKTREEIRRIQKKTGITTIFVTHDQDEAMSICDHIIVMKDGLVMQIGRPQEVYDNPENLFVAKFLGNPPINIFKGYIKDEILYLGEDSVLDVKGIKDQEVYVGIRPEAFILEESGRLKTKLIHEEVMGRDKSIIFAHDGSESDTVRAIIPSDTVVSNKDGIVSFDLKPHKVFLFNISDESRIYFEVDHGKQ